MPCLRRPLIDFVFHLQPGRRSAYAFEVGVTMGADVVLLAPDRNEATFTDQVFSVLACCHEARASPTRLGRCFVSTHVRIDAWSTQTAVQASMFFACGHDTETSTAF